MKPVELKLRDVENERGIFSVTVWFRSASINCYIFQIGRAGTHS